MTDNRRERTQAEILKHRIVGETGEKVATVARAVFDAFTGGGEAVFDSLAGDYEAKKRGEVGIAAMPKRYRCTGCDAIHNEGSGCDAELERHPPPAARSSSSPTDTLRAPPALEAHRIDYVCADCLRDGEAFKRALFDTGAPDECDRCRKLMTFNARAFVVAHVDKEK